VNVDALPGSPNAAKTAASRAAARGEIVPLRRGLYFKGVPTRYGMATPPSEDVALEVLGRTGVGPAGVSAARAFNLTTQVPAVPELATASPIPMNVPGVRIHKRNNMARRELSYHEIALLELLREHRYTNEARWDSLVSTVDAHVAEGTIRPASLLAAVRGERKPAVTTALTRLLNELPDHDTHAPSRRTRPAVSSTR